MKRLVSSKTETQMKSTLLQVCHLSSMRLEPDLVGNPEDLFSHHETHIKKTFTVMKKGLLSFSKLIQFIILKLMHHFFFYNIYVLLPEKCYTLTAAVEMTRKMTKSRKTHIQPHQYRDINHAMMLVYEYFCFFKAIYKMRFSTHISLTSSNGTFANRIPPDVTPIWDYSVCFHEFYRKMK